MFEFLRDKATTTEETSSDPWSGETAKALLAARKSNSGSGSGPEKTTKKGGKADSGGGVSEKVREQLAKLFAPSSWKPIVKAPFAFMQAKTGRKCWELTHEQEENLAVQTSMAMEYVAITDPKWLAIGMCATTWCMIFSEKLIQSAKEAKEEALLHPNPDISPKGGIHGHPI